MSVGGVSGREKSILSWYFGIMDFTNLTRMNLLEGWGWWAPICQGRQKKWRGRVSLERASGSLSSFAFMFRVSHFRVDGELSWSC